jgi:hypothetical protein
MKKITINQVKGLIKPAFAFSIVGGIFAIITFALSIWGSYSCFENHDSMVQNFINFFAQEDPTFDTTQLRELAEYLWRTLTFISVFSVVLSAYSCVLNWIGLAYIKRAQIIGLYSFPIAILQVIAFPFGTIAGILMIVALSKSNKKPISSTKKSKRK